MELAAASKVGLSTIQRIEQGRLPYPTPRILVKLGRIVGEEVRLLASQNGNDLPADAAENNAKLIRVPIRRVPVYRMLPASHLGGPEDMYTVPQEPDEFNKLPAPSGKCAAIQIDGDCMEPDYPSGCYVMVDFGRTAGEGLVPGAAYYVQLRGEGDGKATFKKYVGPEGETEAFECINKVKYPKRILIDSLFDAAIAVAKVDWMAGKRKR